MKIGYIKIKNFRGIKSLEARIKGNFICLIGPGDCGKTSILSAIEYALTPKWNQSFDDSDFFNQDIEQAIKIELTLYNWADNVETRQFFSESKFGLYICGLNDNGTVAEPVTESILAITLQLSVDKSLEPHWKIIKDEDSKIITANDRLIFGLGRIDNQIDSNFTWSRNSTLSKLTAGNFENMTELLSIIARTAKNSPIDLRGCTTIAGNIRTEANRLGVGLNPLTPKIDIQKLSLSNGALSLHEEQVPLRNFGSGSKKLISCAMQFQLNAGKNITLIDELETGLEPHRIRGLIKNLKATSQLVVATTHSPVVLRELTVSENELYVCQKSNDDTVSIKPVNEVPGIQAAIRRNAEAFLSTKIVVCEGPTEIGCLRALDELNAQSSTPVWSLSTAYFDAGGIGNVKNTALKLKELGYEVIVFCDNDTPDQYTQASIDELIGLNIRTICWESGKSIEMQLLSEIPWPSIHGFLEVVANANETTLSSLVTSIKSKISQLPETVHEWIESADLRMKLGNLASGKTISGQNDRNASAWFKRIDLSETVFKYAITQLSSSSIFKTRLDTIWNWIQNAGR